MGIDPTIVESLLTLRTVVIEGVVVESAVVCMIMFDIDHMVRSKLFDGKFGLERFFAWGAGHHVDVTEA